MKTNQFSWVEVLEVRIAPAAIFAVDDSNHLLRFDSTSPGTVISTDITGLTAPATELIKGIDFRPATGQLYVLGINNVPASPDEGRIYTLNTSTGALALVNATPFFTNFQDGDEFAFGFNPSVDRIRVGTDRDDNLRVNPNNGALAGTDTNLGPASSAIVGEAYDRNFEGTPLTTLYGIDQNTDALVTIGGINGTPTPNGGMVSAVGPLGVDLGGNPKAGFDIESHTGTAYAALRPNGGVMNLYTVDLQSGAATLVGAIFGNPALNGLAVALPNDLTIMNATTATYLDQDGDKVTLKITGAAPSATLNAADFVFSTGAVGSQLKLLNFADDGQEWAHASITLTAVPFAGKGDSFATVGYINAAGVDLGKVSINGDLGQIDAGDATTETPGLLSLTAQSLGVVGNSQLPNPGGPDQGSDIVGKLGSLTIKTDMNHAQIHVTGGTTDGSIGPVFIGGDVLGAGTLPAGIQTEGPMGNVKILGSLLGGAAANVGSIISGTTMGSVFVGGSVEGGAAPNAGIIESGTNMGSVFVKGHVIGGTADHTGTIHSTQTMGNVVVLGSIIGGAVTNPGDSDAGLVYAYNPSSGTGDESIGSVKIAGSLIGGPGSFGGSLYADHNIKSVTLGGSLIGGSGNASGTIEVGGNIGAIKIGGEMRGGSASISGSILTFMDGSIASVTIGGAVIGSGLTANGIFAAKQLGAVKIGGDLRAPSGTSVQISAVGTLGATTPALASAIKSITVAGSVSNALIRGGYSLGGSGLNPDAGIGAVKVSGNWIGSNLIAGVTAGTDGFFGTADDLKISGDTTAAIFSKIASVTIKGFAFGAAGAGFRFGIVAEQVGSIKVGRQTYVLAAGTDLVGLDIGPSANFHAREV